MAMWPATDSNSESAAEIATSAATATAAAARKLEVIQVAETMNPVKSKEQQRQRKACEKRNMKWKAENRRTGGQADWRTGVKGKGKARPTTRDAQIH